MARILFVLTSHTDLGDTGRKTGFYFEEMATPYYMLTDAGHDVTLASVAGGAAEPDPASLDSDPDKRPADVRRFLDDKGALAALAASKKLADVCENDFDAVFLPGGHGAMWDFPGNADLARLIGRTFDAGGVVGAVCHGPAGLIDAVDGDGKPIVEGRRVNAFTDSEEAAMGLTKAMPFLLESRLRERGAQVETGGDFSETAIRDGRLVTGQNPMSSAAVARLMLEALADTQARAA